MSKTDDKNSVPQASLQTPKGQAPAAQPVASMSPDQAAEKMRKLGVELRTTILEGARPDLSEVVLANERPASPPETKPAGKATEKK